MGLFKKQITIELGENDVNEFNGKNFNGKHYSIHFLQYDDRLKLINLTIETGREVRRITLTNEQAISIGFINPNALMKFVK